MPASIRAGLDYQDLIAMREIIGLLRAPDEIMAVELEADDVGAFDDVRVRYRNGADRRLQVKFAVNDESQWNWDDLTATGPRDARSLLFKWFDSMANDAAAPAVGEIVTNRRAAEDLAGALAADGRLLFDRVPAPIQTLLASRYGGEERASSIAGRLSFRLEQASFDEMEAQVRHAFGLIANAAHYTGFKDQVRSWGRHQKHRRGAKSVDLHEARRACHFYELVPVPEHLEVPPDFVIPDRAFDEGVVAQLTGSEASLIVLEGDAGAGKSTYVTDLYRRLRAGDGPAVRHHFWLSTIDPTSDRVGFDVIAATLMSQLSEGPTRALLGELVSESPEPRRLGEWLTEAGRNAANAHTSLVILLDGLDHALVPENLNETNRVLAELVTPRPGVKVLIASRPRNYPISLTEREYQRLVLPRLERPALAELLRNNSDHLDLPPVSPSDPPSSADSFDAIVDSLLQRTAGLALHVRIALRLLTSYQRRITVEDVNALPPDLAEGAADFYGRAWSTLRSQGRIVLHMLAAHRLAWQRAEIQKALRQLELTPAGSVSAINEVAFLLDKSTDGSLSIHYSLFHFVQSRPEHAELRDELDAAMRRYLASPESPETWRWGYLPELELQSANAEAAIAGFNRDWFVSAIAMGRLNSDVTRLSMSAMRAALRERDLLGFFTIGSFYDYYAAVYDNDEEIFDGLRLAALRQLIQTRPSQIRVSGLPTKTLSNLVIELVGEGEIESAEPFYYEVARRAHDAISREHVGEDIFNALLEPELRAAGSLGRDSTRVAGLISANAPTGYAGRISAAYISVASRFGHHHACARTLEAALSAGAGREASKAFAEGLLQRGGPLPGSIRVPLDQSCPVVRFLLAVQDHTVSEPSEYAVLPGLNRSLDYVPNRSRTEWQEALHDLVADAFTGRTATFERLRSLAMLRPKMRDVADGLEAFWRSCCSIADRSVENVEQILGSLGAIFRNKPFRGDFLEDQSVSGFRAALLSVLFDCASARIVSPLDVSDLNKMLDAGAQVDSIADKLKSLPRAASEVATRVVISKLVAETDESLDARETRAEGYYSAMTLSRFLDLEEDAKRAAFSIGEALLALGWHKDMYLYSVIEALRAVGASNATVARLLLEQLAAPVAEIHAFTDGDETRYFPGAFGEALFELDPERYPSYYQWLVDREDLFTLERLRQWHLVRATVDAESIALLRTIRDTDAIAEVAKRTPPDELSRTALAMLGNMPPAEEGYSSRYLGEAFAAPDAPPPLDVKQIPPDRLQSIDRADWLRLDLDSWVRYWLASPNADEAFHALREALRREHGSVAESIYEVVLAIRGPADAYDILTASTSWTVWSDFNPSARVRIERLLRENHPDRIAAFLVDTLSIEYSRTGRFRPYPSAMASSLVKHLVETGRSSEALTLVERMTLVAHDLTKAWRFPRPVWLGA